MGCWRPSLLTEMTCWLEVSCWCTCFENSDIRRFLTEENVEVLIIGLLRSPIDRLCSHTPKSQFLQNFKRWEWSKDTAGSLALNGADGDLRKVFLSSRNSGWYIDRGVFCSIICTRALPASWTHFEKTADGIKCFVNLARTCSTHSTQNPC